MGMLPLHVPGDTSFENLQTMDGDVLESSPAACIRLQLQADDTEYSNVLNDASQFQMPR